MEVGMTQQNRSINEPDVYSYLNYREFLKDWMNFKVQKNSHYSATSFLKEAGLSSHTLWGMVTRGQRNLGYSALNGFIKALNLNATQAKYFKSLVRYNQAKKPDEREQYFLEMVKYNRGAKSEQLYQMNNYSHYLSYWYISVIRELVHLDEFDPNPKWIAEKLKNKISLKQIEQAWKVLTDLDLVQFDEKEKRFKVTDLNLVIDPKKMDFVIRNYHKQFIQLSLDSIDAENIEERELSSLAIAVSESEIVEIKRRINEFRRQLNLEFSSSNEKKTKVAVINNQFLLTTK